MQLLGFLLWILYNMIFIIDFLISLLIQCKYVCMCRNDPFKNISGSSNFLEGMKQYMFIIFLILFDSPGNTCTII